MSEMHELPKINITGTGNYLTSLAEKLSLPLVSTFPETGGFCLFVEDEMLRLCNLDAHEKSVIYVDFSSGASTYRREQGGGKNQALGKAIGINKKSGLNVLDATAGMGKDAFVMAGLGCNLTMVEQSPIVAALLQDALMRAEQDASIADLVSTMTLIQANSIEYMQSNDCLVNPPDVVYLDPMYPERKKTAKVKKEMQTLQQLLGHQENTDELLQAALSCALNRVVVKRPKGASPISSKSATHTVESKKTRYDVYMKF